MEHRLIIDKWPTLADFAEDIGVSENTAKQMRTRNSINSRYWTALIEGAQIRSIPNIDYEALASPMAVSA